MRVDGKSSDKFVEEINQFIDSLATEEEKEKATNKIVAIYVNDKIIIDLFTLF